MRRSSSASFILRRSAVSPVRRSLSAPVGGALAPERPRPPLDRPSAAPAAARAALAPAPSAVLRSSGSSSGPRSVRAATWAGWVQPPAWRAAAAWLLAVTPCALRALPPPLWRASALSRSVAPVSPCAAVRRLVGRAVRVPPSDAKRQNGRDLLCKPLRGYTKAPFCIVAALFGGVALGLLPLSPASASRAAPDPLRRGKGLRGPCPRRPRARRLAEGASTAGPLRG